MATCAVCKKPMADQRPSSITSNKRVPAKLYCGDRCVRRAAYLRRKERLASRRVVISDPLPIPPDGWPEGRA